jgi:uncharacterized protein YgiB involved in biofilm formation
MNLDFGTLILIGIIVVAGFLLIKRLMAQQQSPYSQPGNNRPQYDDPNVSSHGGFGGSSNRPQGSGRPQYDDPNVESHGGFGSSGGSNSTFRRQSQSRSYENASSQRTAEKTPENTRRNDDPNVSSHGGFGGKR